MSHIVTTRAAASRPRAALLLLGGLAAIAGIGAAGAATADNDISSLVVRYDAHSLWTDDGANALYRRIVFAARKVCPDDSSRDLRLQHLTQVCRQQAVAQAIKQIDNPHIAAVHAAHSKNG